MIKALRHILELFQSDFSVVLFRPHCMLVSEGYPMKALKNQWLWARPYPPEHLSGATNQGSYYGVCGADAFAVAMPDATPKRDVFTTYCAQSTFMGHHRDIRTHACCNHHTEKSAHFGAPSRG